MSNVSNVHDVIPFVAGKSAALTGQRLARVGYKSTAKNPAKFPSVAVSVPFLSDDSLRENMDSLLPYIKGMMEKTQDDVIRSLYESKDGSLKIETLSGEEARDDRRVGVVEREQRTRRIQPGDGRGGVGHGCGGHDGGDEARCREGLRNALGLVFHVCSEL